MKKKNALITFELIDESITEGDGKIMQEILDWFKEDAIAIPWIKEVRAITVKDP
jgi:hypothetical protein